MSAVAESSTESRSNYTLPSGTTLQHCAKLAIVEDKPIMFDYWTSSCDKEVLIGVRENEEKLLVKSEEEYTSPINKIYKVENKECFFYGTASLILINLGLGLMIKNNWGSF